MTSTDLPQPFAGLTVIVTGDVDGFTRFSANDMIARLGGKPVTSVSGKTGLVIVGEGAGVSKMHKTRMHKLNVIGGPDFAALAADLSSWNGEPVGEPVADYEARLAAEAGEPEPEPELPQVPFHERHLVGKVAHYPRVNGQVIREVRMWCMGCGHFWLGASIHDRLECPVEAGTATLSTSPPWATPDPDDRWDLVALRAEHDQRTAEPTPVDEPAPESPGEPDLAPVVDLPVHSAAAAAHLAALTGDWLYG